jgi:hypothetical protein
MTYAELQTAIASYMHRTDLTAKLPEFISLAESYMFRELDLREMEVSLTGTAVDGYITLPSDFGQMGRLTTMIGANECNVTYNSRTDSYPATNPITYSQEKNKLRLFPVATNQDYTLYYTAKITPLSDVDTTNWLSLNAPDLYLYLSCLEAAKWTRDGDQITILTQFVMPLLESVRNLTKRRAKPNRGSLQMRLKNTLI